MKRLILLVLMGLLLSTAVQAADVAGFLNPQGKVVTRDTLTVDTQYTVYGGWDRACSTIFIGVADSSDTLFEFNDSGNAVVEVSRIVTLNPGQKLYVGLDWTAAAGSIDSSVSDTGMGLTWVSNPADPGRGSATQVPFFLSYSRAADSGVAMNAPVATFATGGSSYELSVKKITLKWYMIAAEAQ